MKYGHVTGTRKQRKPATPWWGIDEELAIQAIEREWAEQATQQANAYRPRARRQETRECPWQ